ncbi:MAG: iron-sulfur cluster-binding protein [Thermoleophilia bacterium]|nr:iron-sulfur cluster-binding protein [Thermoleophilia bacterium]
MSATREDVGGTPLPPGWAQPAHQPDAFEISTTTFEQRATETMARPFARRAIANATDHAAALTTARFVGIDHDALRDKARQIRAHAIANLPDYLDQWIDAAEAHGTIVHYAADESEARRIVAQICRDEAVTRVVKSKSMASEEVSLNSALEAIGIDIYETDLGEFVVQAMGDRPGHVIAPILHRTKDEVHALFSTMAGRELPNEAEALTAFARDRLRHAFLTADAGISGGNFLIAETGEVLLVTNEGNGRLTTALPKIHIALVGIEKIVPRRRDLAVLLPLLTGHGTGQQITTYVTMVAGPRREQEPDGPERMHVVLLDAGRSALLGGEFEEALHCIRCGACQNVCPVYRQVGGHAYGWVYGGPIGAVLTPLFRGQVEGGELAHATTLCGACDDVCPVKIPLHDLLLGLRRRRDEEGCVPRSEQLAFALWGQVWSRPLLYRASTAVARGSLRVIARDGVLSAKAPLLRRWTAGRDLVVGRRRS